jgi:hypothetical protein
MKGLKALMIPLAALTLVVAGCSDSTSTPIARISLALTDAPGDVDSVWVEIEEIYLQGGPGGRTELLSADDADELGLIELTQLAGSTLDLVEDVQIPAGNYGQLRFVLAGAVLETEGHEVYTFNTDHPHGLSATGSLKCPSCDNTGIKVLLPGEAADLEAGSHLIVLDFDVSQSFGHIAGGSGSWVMHPVILGAELGFTGAVTGVVDVERDADENPLVEIPECPAGTARDLTAFVPVAVAQTLEEEGEPFTSTAVVAEDGTFSFAPLAADQYDFGYETEIEVDGSVLTLTADAPGLLDVTSGGSLELTYTITAASCVTP